MMRPWPTFATLALGIFLGLAASRAAEPPALPAAGVEFFENRIRPVLVEHCYKCHNSSGEAQGELAVDHRAALLRGGAKGPVIVPGKPAESRLLPILRHEIPGLKMPEDGAKLDAQTIADFSRWIALGAPDPRDQAPTAAEVAQATRWDAVFLKRKTWWSFQPLRAVPPPTLPDNTWSDHPIDRFVLAGLRQHGLTPNPPADAATLVRRLYFVLIGLPPTAAEAERWTARLGEPGGYEALVDHLLASPHFGERWARHWMDWIRYADSHGSEGDPANDNAWHFRDYLIRALNADVAFDQLVREQIAGDLLEAPRRNAALGINESSIGPAHWRMVFHGFAPTDALEEKARFLDDEINAFTKAFLGLTVSCARCHDHKFDAIGQADYYALYGILASCRPGRTAIDLPERIDAHRGELTALKPRIRAAIAATWREGAAGLRAALLDADGPAKKADAPQALLHFWRQLNDDVRAGAAFDAAWQKRVAAWQADRQQREAHARRPAVRRWNLADAPDAQRWYRTGVGLAAAPSPPGEFAVAPAGNLALVGIYPAGVYSHLISDKHPARLESEDVRLDGEYELWIRALGDGGAAVRYVVEDYPRSGVVYPANNLGRQWHWQRFDLTYWKGDEIHLELTAGRDAPLLVNGNPRSWFGIREALLLPKGQPAPPADPRAALDPFFAAAATAGPRSPEEVAERFVQTLTAAIQAWQAGTASDAQAELLDACLQQGLLPNGLGDLPQAKPLIEDYRRLEGEIVAATRVPGLSETTGRDHPLFLRGNHKQLGPSVPRRFLAAIDDRPYQTTASGRRQLAEDLLRADNPLTRRVIVNRLWHHLFGRGIVGTPDNLGRLGEEPTHPELLDYLATHFRATQGSIKGFLRWVVLSKTWQQASRPSAAARQTDPDNRWLSHARVRRLEAEAIRDALLAVSGTLNADLYGAPVEGHVPRRSVYVRVQRNALDPFLRAFDFPEPFSTTGRRDVTNVPAQSLTLLNDARIAALAGDWAGRVIADPQLAAEVPRIRAMYLAALGRAPRADEVALCQDYLAQAKAGNSERARQWVELRGRLERDRAAVAQVVAPVRDRLLAAAKAQAGPQAQRVPAPLARWEFEGNLRDAMGEAHGEAQGGARVDGGALEVGPTGHVVTAPLKQSLKEKTLEAWVQLANLEQRGGGVISVQSRDGETFDAIVFGEQQPAHWMAGSNFFQRTQPFHGTPESGAADQAVHLAIVYQADGQIVGYRQGQPYGRPYASKGPIEFKAGETVVGFGLRHLPAGGNKHLAGRILLAQLYDRALTADEIRATSQAAPYYVTESQVLAALPAADRQRVAALQAQMAAVTEQIAALGPAPQALDERALWTDFARAMFTFNEFIYLK